MPSSRSVRVTHRPSFDTLSQRLSRHRAATHATLAAVCLAIALVASPHPLIRGGLLVPSASTSILPAVIGAGLPTDAAIEIALAQPMDPGSVEALAMLVPGQPVAWRWSADGSRAWLSPATRWATDQRYLLTIPGSTNTADGTPLRETLQFSFTTVTAPTIVDLRLSLAAADIGVAPHAAADPEPPGDAGEPSAAPTSPPDSVAGVSSRTTISLTFSTRMDRGDVARHFLITPDVPGRLTWLGTTLTFIPGERLVPGTRYSLSIVGAHDAAGNLLGGDASFSFTTVRGAQVVKVAPVPDARGVTDGTLTLWFSQPMATAVTGGALTVTDATSRRVIPGSLTWNAARTQLRWSPDAALARGRRFEVRLGTGAADADGNPLTASWAFTTRAAATVNNVAPAPPASAPPTSTAPMQAYALSQINAARASYGRAPLTLDATISAVAYAHAQDMLVNGYFSHTSLDGSTTADRLQAAGVAFGYSGENLCSYNGMPSVQAVLDWCQSGFMSEAYPPPPYNHKSNILSQNYRRVGIGIAQIGDRIIVVWDFAD